MKMLFNIVAVLVWQKITSLARPKTWLAKAKDLTFKAKDSKFVLEDISRPRTKAKDNNTAEGVYWKLFY